MSTLIVYETVGSREKNPADYERFIRSLDLIAARGIQPEIRTITDAEEMGEGEARDLVSAKGMEILPVTEYEGTVVSFDSYPTDQELVDYLDVPDRVLGASRAGTLKDMEYGCTCCSSRPR